MKTNLLAFLAILTFSSQVNAQKIPSFESRNPSAHCQNEWTKRGQLDQRMFNYCMNKEREGYENLRLLSAKYSKYPWIQEAINYSLDKWTQRGITTYNMTHYTLKEIVEGFEDIEYEKKQPNFNNRKLNDCSKKWGIQFQMISYCYSN